MDNCTTSQSHEILRDTDRQREREGERDRDTEIERERETQRMWKRENGQAKKLYS